MDTNNKLIDSEQLILYALGELDPIAMAEVDKIAFENPELDKELDSFLNLVQLMEESPELQNVLSNPSLFKEFLRYLSSLGSSIWPWRTLDTCSNPLNYLSDIFQRMKQQTEKPYILRPAFRKMTDGVALAPPIHRESKEYDCSLSMVSYNQGYQSKQKNEFVKVSQQGSATFGIVTNTASISICKTSIEQNNQLPPPESVRAEEYINYFDWKLPEPEPNDACPLKPTVEIGRHPQNSKVLLAKIGIQGRTISKEKNPPVNLTFLIDVSSSMSDWNKLPLLKEALCRLIEKLRDNDSISIVTYSENSNVVLESSLCSRRWEIEKEIQSLTAAGSINGDNGLKLAYQQARKNFNPEGINRVVLCSDGNFNVGISNSAELDRLIQNEAKSGVFLTVLGFGIENYKDSTMELLAKKGLGAYHYINDHNEIKRIMEDATFANLITIAKDVKIQVDFNPNQIESYRLIGYDNQTMDDTDFNNDNKEAGNICSGQNVIALFELIPVEMDKSTDKQADSRYEALLNFVQNNVEPLDRKSNLPIVIVSKDNKANLSDELFQLKIRWKNPSENVSQHREYPIAKPSDAQIFNTTNAEDFRFACATALFAHIMANSTVNRSDQCNQVIDLIGTPESSQRQEFAMLVKKARDI